MNYEKRVVAFVDISRDFEDAVNSTVDENGKQDEKRINEIEDALWEIKKIMEPDPGWVRKLQKTRSTHINLNANSSETPSLLAFVLMIHLKCLGR